MPARIGFLFVCLRIEFLARTIMQGSYIPGTAHLLPALSGLRCWCSDQARGPEQQFRIQAACRARSESQSKLHAEPILHCETTKPKLIHTYSKIPQFTEVQWIRSYSIVKHKHSYVLLTKNNFQTCCEGLLEFYAQGFWDQKPSLLSLFSAQ